MKHRPWEMLSWPWPCSQPPYDDKNFSGKREDIPSISAPKATILTNCPVSGNEVETPILENRTIRVSTKQLHKQEDFFGAVLSKDESEKKRHRRGKNYPLLPLPNSAAFTGSLLAGACRCTCVSLSLNLPRNTGRWLCQSGKMPSQTSGSRTPPPTHTSLGRQKAFKAHTYHICWQRQFNLYASGSSGTKGISYNRTYWIGLMHGGMS